MDREFEKLIEAIVADGKVTGKERDVLYRAADKLGIDRDTADVMLDAALHSVKESGDVHQQDDGARKAGPSVRTTCEKCGAPIEPVLSNCLYCKAPIRGLNTDSIDDDELIMRASEWIGKISDGVVRLVAPNANEWTGRGIKTMQKGEISGMAAKYLHLLEVRAQNHSTLAHVVTRLRADYDSQRKSLARPHKIGLIAAASMVGIMIFAFIMAGGESKKEEAALEQLTHQEEVIQEAIANGEYSRARALVIQLEWPDAASLEDQNIRFSEKYDQKRKNYLEMIDKLEAQSR